MGLLASVGSYFRSSAIANLSHLKEFGVLYPLATPIENAQLVGHHRESRSRLRLS
jgi:hypothetical protein